MHRDVANLSYGVCMVSSFGNYDWEHGGELFLLEAGLIVQMQPGDLLIFPSASITHGNFDLSSTPGQTRYSFTAYTAGALFQWNENGANLVEVSDTPARADRNGGWDMFSHLNEIQNFVDRYNVDKS